MFGTIEVPGVGQVSVPLVRYDAKQMRRAMPRLLEHVGFRGDANEAAFFSRELEHIYTETYDIEYPDAKARLLIPVDTRVPTGAESFTYRQYDKQGEARIVSNYSTDFPNASVTGAEFPQRIVSIGNSYQYSVQDLRNAAQAGKPLDAMLAEAARFAQEVRLETLAATGDSQGTPIYGLTNAPNISATTQVSTGTWKAQLNTSLSAGVNAIVGDINAMAKKIFVDTLEKHTANTLVLPTDVYALLATTPRSPTFTDDSLLNYILKQNPWLKSIESWNRLNTAGASSHGRVMCYDRNPRVLQLVIPQEFEQFAPQPLGMAWVIPCHSRCGGVTVRYPKAVTYMDGVTDNS